MAAIVEGLAKNVALETLHLSKNRFSFEGLKKLAEGNFGKSSQLRVLDLSRNDVCDEGIEFIVQGFKAREDHQMQQLILKETNLGDKGC
jgi:Ran GTPase-activating protein (RanGAP) involved in mRNA processing and transport